MAPIRLRLLLVVFVALAAGISFNALYRQVPHRLAGGAVTAPAEKPERERRSATASLPKETLPKPAGEARERPEEARPAAPREAPRRTRSEAAPVPGRLIKAIQRELALRGYDPGPVNGELGLETRSAIIAYEFDEGMPLKGEPTELILKSLIFDPATATATRRPPVRFERHGALIAEVQKMLASMGYTSGPIDGRLDSRTRDAIRKFESDRNLDARGRITARILLEMVIMTGQPFPARAPTFGTG